MSSPVALHALSLLVATIGIVATIVAYSRLRATLVAIGLDAKKSRESIERVGKDVRVLASASTRTDSAVKQTASTLANIDKKISVDGGGRAASGAAGGAAAMAGSAAAPSAATPSARKAAAGRRLEPFEGVHAREYFSLMAATTAVEKPHRIEPHHVPGVEPGAAGGQLSMLAAEPPIGAPVRALDGDEPTGAPYDAASGGEAK